MAIMLFSLKYGSLFYLVELQRRHREPKICPKKFLSVTSAPPAPLIIQIVVKLICKEVASPDRPQIRKRLNSQGVLKILLLLAFNSGSPRLFESQQARKARSLQWVTDGGTSRIGHES